MYDPIKMMDALTVIRHEQSRLWRLFSDKNYSAFAESVARISEAATKAGFQAHDLMWPYRGGEGK